MTTVADFDPPSCADSVLDAPEVIIDPRHSDVRERIRADYRQHVALFLGMTADATHLRCAGYKPTAHVPFFRRDDVAVGLRPDLSGLQRMHTLSLTLTVADFAICPQPAHMHASIDDLIDSAPPSLRLIIIILEFGCRWPTDAHMAALQLQHVDIVRLLRR